MQLPIDMVPDMRTRYRRMRGFTLIELLVVMALVSILASIAVPSYQDSIRKARRAEGRAALMQLMQQQERYYSLHTRYLAFSRTSEGEDEQNFKWYSGDSASQSAYEIAAAACDGETIQDCVELTASPGTAHVNSSFKDAECGSLSLTSTGSKAASGTASNCW